MDRRRFLLTSLAGAVAVPLAVEAQQPDRTARVGFLGWNLTESSPGREAFRQGLRELGYIEGRNLVIDYRDAEGKIERFPALAAELVELKVDVIVTTGGTLGALAAKRATASIPVVFTGVGNPVDDGLVASLARPGGNVTGLALVSSDLVGKTLDLLKQAVPELTRVAFLRHPDAVPESAKQESLKRAEIVARELGIRLQVVEARGPGEFERAFSEMTRARAGALTVLGTAVYHLERHRLVELAARHRLPAAYSFREFVDAGGLMSYGPGIADLSRRAATYVDRILKGAKPGDLPVEQPTKFELVINLKTAKALGLTISPSLLARADQVIE